MRTEGSLYTHRILNGVLKAQTGLADGVAARGLLTKNIELVCDKERAKGDLWPCIWAMAAALARQFEGTIYINCGFSKPLSAPARLPENCIFTGKGTPATIRIGIGHAEPSLSLVADARGNRISVGKLLASAESAHPISCFAAAGYTAFGAMAAAAEIPPFRQSFVTNELELPFANKAANLPELSLLGLGQLGQAYLALLYFLTTSTPRPSLFVIDKDVFESQNFDTQILLSGNTWEGTDKTEYIRQWARRAGFFCKPQKIVINWGWKALPEMPKLALLGLDDFDVRRMCATAGFSWLLEAGLGTSFSQPKVTWHSFPPDAKVATQLFGKEKARPQLLEDVPYAAELKRTPGGCGWVTFDNTSATAPSMGLVGAAFAFSELFGVLDGRKTLTRGSAYLWSPLIPFLRREDDHSVGAVPSKFVQKH